MNVLIRPHLTEKSLIEASKGRYTFVVAKEANKATIQQAVKIHFNVEVANIQTRNVKGEIKVSRTSRKKIKTKNYKKAVVTLKDGKRLDIFEVTNETETKND